MRINNIDVYELELKLRKPYKISFKTAYYAVNLLVEVKTDEGLVGYGEAAPTKRITGDTREEALAFLRGAIPFLKNRDPCDLADIHRCLEDVSSKTGLLSQTAKAAVDYACYDIWGKAEGRPIYQLLGLDRPQIVPASIGLGIEAPEDLVRGTEEYMERFNDNGPWLMKLKFSGEPEMDLKRVMAVAEVFPREMKIDPNQAYTDPRVAVETFNEIYDSLGSKIALIEEPCPKGELEKMRYVTENTEIPIYADESGATLQDIKDVIRERAADGVNIKLPKIGGIYWAVQAAKLLEEADMKIQVGPGIESRVGLAAAANFAAGTPSVSHTDLDADIYFDMNIVTDESLPFIWGARIPSGGAGLGVKIKREFKSILNNQVLIRKQTI
jgi:L-alanine-DL-glutamate epimerase-like enolase superfamily enzyme